MNSIHSSRAVRFGVALGVATLVLVAVGIAGGFTFETVDTPEDGEVGETAEATVSFDPFETHNAPIEIQASSALEDATVTITADGERVDRSDTGSASAVLDDPGIRDVTVEVSGTVPDIDRYSYADSDLENVLLLRVAEGGVTEGEWELHRYTSDSQDARTAIDDASAVVDDSDNEDAQERLEEAKTFYDDGNFDEAITAATDAQSMVDTDDDDDDSRLVYVLVAGFVLLAAVVGAGLYYRQTQQQPANKLQ